MRIYTVDGYDKLPPNDLRSDIGYAVWVLGITYGNIIGLPCGFRTQWKERLKMLTQ